MQEKIKCSSKQLDILWKYFLAYQAQFHARDFVAFNPRDNKARFIKTIRSLVSHKDFSTLDIDIELLLNAETSNSSRLAPMRQLCALIEGHDPYTLKEINADEHAAITLFKQFNSTQWTAHITAAVLSKEKSDIFSPKEQQASDERVAAAAKNTRRRTDPLSAVALDVDLQQQSDIQNSFQMQSMQSTESQEEQAFIVPASKDSAISFNAFWDQIVQDKSFHPLQITKEVLRSQWCHWSAGRNKCTPKYPDKGTAVSERALVEGDIQFTSAAAMELFKWRRLFQAGIDIHHLPAGFSITKNNSLGSEESYLLDYLPKLKEITELDKLAIQCQDPPELAAGLRSRLTLDEANELFKEYNEHSVRHLYEHVLKYFPEKAALEANDEYMQAIKIILNLPPSQRAWWEQLFEQHTRHCGRDDFPGLVAGFQEFLVQLTQYHQHFDFYPPKFGTIKSMPVALTQMLALLNQVKNEDRQMQWHCITELPLTGYEVGKALRTKEFSILFNEVQMPCSFIVPAMHVEEINVFEGRFDLLFPCRLDWFRDKVPLEPQDAERLFYLALSHKQFRLPLAFYQEKIKEINKTNLDDAAKRRLYDVLVGSCTGTTAQFILKSPKHIEDEWALFISTIKKMSVPTANQILEQLFVFNEIPEIHLLNKLFATIGKEEVVDAISEQRYFLNRLAEEWDPRKAHQLINKKENTSWKHLWDMRVCFKLECWQLNYLSLAVVFDFLPALEYSEKVQPGDGTARFKTELREVLKQRLHSERTYALDDRIIDRLSCLVIPKGKPLLTVDQFIKFYKDVSKKACVYEKAAIPKSGAEFHFYDLEDHDVSFDTFYSDQDFIDPILREHFSEYVDESLLVLSALDPNDLERLILRIKAQVKDKNAQTTLKTILTELSCERASLNGHSALVDKLIIIANNYPGEEGAEFLLNIHNHLGVGKLLSKESNRGFATRLDQLNGLLQTIIETGSITRFEFLMAEFENIPEPNNRNPIQKLSYALSRVLGLMNKGLGPNPHIQAAEQLLLCKEFISAHSANSLICMQNNPIKDPGNDEALFITMLQSINKISAQYPTHARALNSFFIQCYATMNTISGSEQLTSSLKRATNLCEQLSAFKDPALVLSVIHIFVATNNTSLFSIHYLEELFEQCPNEQWEEFFKILISQINQDPKSINTKNTDAFLQLLVKEKDSEPFSIALKTCFSQVPFPSFSKFTGWWNELQDNPVDDKPSIQDKYLAFIKQPFPRLQGQNGFVKEEALQQVKTKEMQNIAARYSEEFIDTFHDTCTELRDLSPAELMSSLQAAKDSPDPARLVAIMAELLFRSTGQEINTTQYLAVDALLSTGTHVTSEIDTGEGKTRIAMLLLACRAYCGHTCDFVTSDMQLAEAAYLSYKSFFERLGIQCRIIRSDSNIAEYQVGAIHFSDCGNLSLFRNKAIALGQLHQALDPRPEFRTLLLDEADKTRFDLHDTSYNFSTAADETLHNMEWVYYQLIQFFSEDGYTLNPEVMQDYYDDVAQCTKKFREWVNTYATRPQAAQLLSVTDAQIATWHESAVAALSLKYQIDFVVQANTRVKTNEGPKVASRALVVADNQVNEHSKFSNGVHQCLEARLNILRHKELNEQSSSLDRYLHDKCTKACHIASEYRVISSSSSEQFLNDYREGSTYGMTGTAGSDTEKREVEELLGIAGDSSKKHFIKMPRHKENLRVDRPVTIVPKNSDKIALLVKHIIDAQHNNQPVLIFCDNDREATLVTEQLQVQLQTIQGNDAQSIALRHIKSTTALEDQRVYLANEAGKPGAVTISTGMLGRGKDILLHSNAVDHGLRTIDLSYPNYRELHQRSGRAGRNGQKGETYIILSEEELKTKYRLRYSEPGLQLIESLLLRRQGFETDKNQLERRVKMALHQYLGQYQSAYFSILIPWLKKNNLELSDTQKALWVTAFKEMILMKQTALHEVMGMIHNPDFSVQKLRLITDGLHTSIQPKWNKFLNELVPDQAIHAEISTLVNEKIHTMELQDWEKRRILAIKNEQLRPFRERIVTNEIKSNESFWVFLHRKLFEFAQWISWSSLAKYLNARFHFNKPISDKEIDSLVYKTEEDSYSILVKALGTHNEDKDELEQPSVSQSTEDLHTVLFKPEEPKVEGESNIQPEDEVRMRV